MVIDKEILDDEILVRYVFADDFKRKEIAEEKIITKNLLGPLRGGTSLQRERYCSEIACVKFGSKIPNKQLVGFLLFRKSSFESIKKDFLKSSENLIDPIIFDAIIKATPLDENNNYLDFNESEIMVETPGNPAHADLIYLNPKSVDDNNLPYERPNTTIRSFSKKMYKKCILTLDESIIASEYSGASFREIMSAS